MTGESRCRQSPTHQPPGVWDLTCRAPEWRLLTLRHITSCSKVGPAEAVERWETPFALDSKLQVVVFDVIVELIA